MRFAISRALARLHLHHLHHLFLLRRCHYQIRLRPCHYLRRHRAHHFLNRRLHHCHHPFRHHLVRYLHRPRGRHFQNRRLHQFRYLRCQSPSHRRCLIHRSQSPHRHHQSHSHRCQFQIRRRPCHYPLRRRSLGRLFQSRPLHLRHHPFHSRRCLRRPRPCPPPTNSLCCPLRRSNSSPFHRPGRLSRSLHHPDPAQIPDRCRRHLRLLPRECFPPPISAAAFFAGLQRCRGTSPLLPPAPWRLIALPL